MSSNYRFLKRIFLNVLSLIEVQMLGTNCQIKYVQGLLIREIRDLASFKRAIS